MVATSTFTVSDFTPVEQVAEPVTALAAGVTRMRKTYSGDLSGHSVTLMLSAHRDPVGTYLALESFEGTLSGLQGTFNFLHSASTTGTDRTDEIGRIVEHSGTGQLAGIRGTVRLVVDPDGTHRLELDYALPPR